MRKAAAEKTEAEKTEAEKTEAEKTEAGKVRADKKKVSLIEKGDGDSEVKKAPELFKID